MPPITSRVSAGTFRPYRTSNRISSKIIFLSCEGCITEESYFKQVSRLFCEIGSKIQLISVAEDAILTPSKLRTPEQNSMLSKTRPKQLVNRIDAFKRDKEDKFEFSKYPEDEFWIITDVDNNWSDTVIPGNDGKTYIQEWMEAIEMCQERNYDYAVSNPFFEMWLLLHHDEATDSDKAHAVTDSHAYDSNSGEYFRDRLRELNVALKDKKHIKPEHYTVDKIKKAVERAEILHLDKEDKAPRYYATTVYLLLNKIMDMLSKNE